MRLLIVIIILAFFASLGGAIFVLKQERKIIIEDNSMSALTPGVSSSTSALTPGVDGGTPGVEVKDEDLIKKSEEFISQAQKFVLEAQKFIDEERIKSSLIAQALEKSSQVKGIYVGASRNFNNFKNLLDQTELNGLVIDVKESYGTNLSPSLRDSITGFHQKDIWAIARIAVFRDSSLVQERPEWYLMATSSLWQDNAKQYWLDPQNQEVQDYIIEFSKKVIDYGFDELQFDYIRYPDKYEDISGQEKIKVIGDFFMKLSEALRSYKPSIILSADLFGYVATQFNSYGTGQRLLDAGKYFDYLSFMLYPSHFYGGFAANGVSYAYPEVVEHPYEVIYYSVKASYDYLSILDLPVKIRPWLQDFDLAVDSARGVFYDSEKISLQIDAAENATSSGWLLWNPSYLYTEEALE